MLLNAESVLTTSSPACIDDGLAKKIQDLIISLDAVLTAGLSFGYDFCEIPKLQNAQSFLSWCQNVLSISSSSPSVRASAL